MKLLKRAAIISAGILGAVLIGITVTLYIKFLSPVKAVGKVDAPPLLFYNGTIITVDEKNPRVEAVLVSGETIQYAGTLAGVEKVAPENTRKIDLKGKTLIPGFNDNHTHSFAAGSMFSELLLWNKTCEEIAELVSEEVKGKKPGEPVYGNLWDYPTCPKPDKSILDKAAPNNPVYLVQYSGHAAWVNSYQLREMGIDRNTPDPEGGQIVRDKNGEPTGVLRDTATGSSEYGKFMRQLLDSEVHESLIRNILRHYRENGICSVQDNTWEPFTARLLRELKGRGELTCRFTCWLQGNSIFYPLFQHLTRFEENDTWLRRGLVKYFADGAFSTRTAWMFEPYADEPDNYGSPRYSTEELEEIVMSAARDKQQITFHAIGDRAIHEVLNAVEKAQGTYPWTRELRFRLEHVQIMKKEDIARMKKLGVLACVQPFTLQTPKKDVTLLGVERARQAYPFYSLFKAGVPVSFGSDVPAEVNYAPIQSIYYAVTRKNLEGTEGPLNPAERFTPYEALYCYTMGSAYAEFMEDKKGSITEGKLADLVVLSDNILAVPAETIKNIKVFMTVVGGRVVYKRDGFL